MCSISMAEASWGSPTTERRELLESLQLSGDRFGTPPSIRGARGAAILAVAAERGLEGVVVKRRTSTYAPGRRTGDWVKVKIFHTQEVVIGGWTPGRGERSGSLGALLLGIPTPEGLEYAGKVGTGFSDSARSQLLSDLTPLAAEESPFTEGLRPAERAQARFVRPELVGEVRFAEWTDRWTSAPSVVARFAHRQACRRCRPRILSGHPGTSWRSPLRARGKPHATVLPPNGHGSTTYGSYSLNRTKVQLCCALESLFLVFGLPIIGRMLPHLDG